MRPHEPAQGALSEPRRLELGRMDSGAACRTYNVLVSEGRRVAAALIAID